jgi:tetratricopeptide (TPR) repeat protein
MTLDIVTDLPPPGAAASGYEIGAQAFADAAEATDRPDHKTLRDAVLRARRRNDVAAMIDLAATMRRHFPAAAQGYDIGVFALRTTGRLDEAEAVLRDAETRFPGAAWVAGHAGWIAHRRGDPHEAERCWEAARAADPNHEESYRGSAELFRKADRLDEAAAVLTEALARFPKSRWVLANWALLAHAQSDHAEAERRWAAAALVLPDDRDIAFRHATARSLEDRRYVRDWPAALIRLAVVTQRFPDFAKAWAARIEGLRATGSRDDAERLAADCLERMPDEPALALEYAATVAAESGAPAADRLIAAAARFPENAALQSRIGEALVRLGRFDEADRLYEAALRRHPGSFDLACGYAEAAMRRGDWTAALQRWAAPRRLDAYHFRVQRGLLDTHVALGGRSTLATVDAGSLAADAASDLAEIYRHFESLGGTGQGCEFGRVQRDAGVEPIGLLRWSLVMPGNLVKALNERFQGVGTPQQTVLGFYQHSNLDDPEYWCGDSKYETRMHTFVRKRDMAEAEMFAQCCRRMAYLRRQLIEDLEDAEKIFVYKIYERNLRDEEIAALHRAMRSYGDNTLLYVRYADESHPSGTVDPVAEGLLIGYISGFNVSPDNVERPPDLPAWNAICRSALAIVNSRR